MMLTGTITNIRPIIAVKFCNSKFCVTAHAIIDTGASHSLISQLVATSLNLPIHRMGSVRSANGKSAPSSTYVCELELPNHSIRRVMEFGSLPNPLPDLNAVIGMDLLSLGAFTLNQNTFTLTIPCMV
ncbi:MAG: hypothetical protein EOO61_03885 [Hymenobacter sp.]|nr:MAG: hypothetical protein EOO61_03885 [Hymenobacter sp.]